MAAECVGVMPVMSTLGTGAALAETERVELLLRPISNKLIFFDSWSVGERGTSGGDGGGGRQGTRATPCRAF